MSPHYVYIIYSKSFDRFYIGETVNVAERIKQHNTGFYEHSSTKFVSDWSLYQSIVCENRAQALNLERFIKRMKSRKFISRLKEEPGLIESLLEKFSE
jgi:putative endonuclease